MNDKTIELNKTVCDKCAGDGKNFAPGSHEFFKRWRKNLGVSQRTVAALLKADVALFSKFENGREVFSEKRQRKLAQILSDWNNV